MKEDRYRERPASTRPKMPLSQRAKQFAPFDALTGLSERLRLAEEEHRRERESAGLVHAGLESELNEEGAETE